MQPCMGLLLEERMSEDLTTTEAAELIGITLAQVGWLIRRKKLRATPFPHPSKYGFIYKIERKEAERYRDSPRRPGPQKAK